MFVLLHTFRLVYIQTEHIQARGTLNGNKKNNIQKLNACSRHSVCMSVFDSIAEWVCRIQSYAHTVSCLVIHRDFFYCYLCCCCCCRLLLVDRWFLSVGLLNSSAVPFSGYLKYRYMTIVFILYQIWNIFTLLPMIPSHMKASKLLILYNDFIHFLCLLLSI